MYTATLTSANSFTITAGGGLGADWSANSIGYIPSLGRFFYVSSVSTNVLNIPSYVGTPVDDTSVTSWSIQRVATPGSLTATNLYIFNSAYSTLTITDCWTSPTTRVTDGTVVSLISTSGSNAYFVITDAINCSIDLAHTYIINASGQFYMSNGTTFTIAQMAASSAAYGFIAKSASFNYAYKNVTITIGHLSCTRLTDQGSGIELENSTITISALYIKQGGNLFGSASNLQLGLVNSTLNVGPTVTESLTINVYGSGSVTTPCTFNFSSMDIFSNVFSALYLQSFLGPATVNISTSAPIYYNRRASSIAGAPYLYSDVAGYGDVVFPTLNVPAGWAGTTSKYSIGKCAAIYGVYGIYQNMPVRVLLPESGSYTLTDRTTYNTRNILLVYKDGTTPREILSLSGMSTNFISSTALNAYVELDNAVYRTAGPSLKMQMVQNSFYAWGNGTTNSYLSKCIKIPVSAGITYTITAYARSDTTAYVANDIQLLLIQGGTVLASASVTPAGAGTWMPLTLTATAPYTGEAVLSWKMRMTGSTVSAYYLDDIVITS